MTKEEEDIKFIKTHLIEFVKNYGLSSGLNLLAYNLDGMISGIQEIPLSKKEMRNLSDSLSSAVEAINLVAETIAPMEGL